MRRQYDMLHAIILLLLLIIANFIDNAIIKGILLLLFSVVLMINTAMKLKSKKDNRFRNKLSYFVLLLLNMLLAAGAIYALVLSIIGA